MIYESHAWRSDLIRFSRSLARARETPIETDAQSARVERDVMYGFFAVRKLEESYKLTDVAQRRTCTWLRYPAFPGKKMPRHRRQEIDEHFDLNRPEKVQLTARELANQVIHSYVFVHVVDRQEKLRGIFVTSDLGRKRGILYVPAWRIVRMFRRVAADDPTDWRMTFDRESGEYRYKSWKRRKAA